MISGYLRDDQEALAEINNQHACDPDLIRLYQAAAKYSVECSGKIEGSKYVFKEHCDYLFWKVHNNDTLSNAYFQKDGFEINPARRNLFLAMPFHLSSEQSTLQNWSSEFLGKAIDNHSVFSSQVDVYLAHFPIEQPRGEKFSLCLNTIRDPEYFYEKQDLDFVRKNFAAFLGTDLSIDDNGKILSGKPYSPQTFKQNCRNITIVGYCAGGAHAHRWINAFSDLSQQLYDQKTTQEALQNIFVISYAFLPVQKETKYSGVHFMSNYTDDHLRQEPFVKMFNPELYEKCKYHQNSDDNRYRLTRMPDNRNYIMAMRLPEDFQTYNENNQPTPLKNEENGHHMAFVTKPNLNSADNFPLKCFSTVLENASLGYRGREVFMEHPQSFQVVMAPITRRYPQASR